MICFLKSLFFLILPSFVRSTEVSVQRMMFDESVKVNVSRDRISFVMYRYNQSAPNMTYMRIFIEVSMDLGQSVSIVINNNNDYINRIQLYNLENISRIMAERTICEVPFNLENIQSKILQIEVGSNSLSLVNVSLKLKRLNNFELDLNKEYTHTFDAMAPVYFMYKFMENIEEVNVKVSSSDETCMVFSVQQAECPVNEMPRNIEVKGSHQSVMKSGTMVVRKSSIQNGTFFIVFAVTNHNVGCKSDTSILTRKTIVLSVVNIPFKKEYILATSVLFSVFLLFFVLTQVLYVITKRRTINPFHSEAKEMIISENKINAPKNYSNNEEEVNKQNIKYVGKNDFFEIKIPSEKDKLDVIDDSNKSSSTPQLFPELYLSSKHVFLSDLFKYSVNFLQRKYMLYTWYMIIISIFYALPVLQLVIYYKNVLSVTGNQDLCFYNFKCIRPFYSFISFNNVFSNIGYILLGFLFILITYQRDRKYIQRYLCPDKKMERKGIPQLFGLYYALGIALIMEGIMSASYHICPTKTNFQFDTSYMYIISCLCILKIYQIRHPDFNSSAHSFFLSIALIIFVGVLGVVYNSFVFWIIFSTLYIIFFAIMSLEIYYFRIWRLNLGLPKLVIQIMIKEKCSFFRPTFKSRLFLLFSLNLYNYALAIYGLVTRPYSFPNYLLIVLLSNLFIYLGFYILMKIIHCEHFSILALIYITLAVICWIFALFCFQRAPTRWQFSPAESREYNSKCIFLNFYDIHDVWHILSAMALFFSFQGFQHLDDPLKFTDQQMIPVF